MNEELIKQCAAEVAFPDTGELAIRLYHARHVAPLEQENAELRALVKDLTAQAKADGERIGRLEANVAPLVEAKLASADLERRADDFMFSQLVGGQTKPRSYRAIFRRALKGRLS